MNLEIRIKQTIYDAIFYTQKIISKYFAYILLISLLLSMSLTYIAISTDDTPLLGPDPSLIIALVLLNTLLLLSFILYILRSPLRNLFNRRMKLKRSSLQDRVIATFCIVAIVPTLSISIFSVIFFNFGIKSWFDKRIENVLENSINIAERYIDENTIQLRNTTWALADDLNNMYYDLINDSDVFTNVLNAQAQIRGLNEAMVFQQKNNTILAQTSLSFSLSFLNIPIHLMQKARNGEIIEIKDHSNKIRMLVKLKEYEDSYLLVGKLIDPEIITYLNQTNGAAAEYIKLQQEQSALQAQFSMIFVLVIILLLVVTLFAGIMFTSSLLHPINALVQATQEVKKGNLKVTIAELHTKDELQILIAAFNHMVTQLDKQQRDLIIAQRASAWSDVARRVAHEIKNPLTPIQLSAERLKQKLTQNNYSSKEYSQMSRYIDTILRHSHDINIIVSEFVSFAKMPVAQLERADIVSVIYELIASRKLINEKIKYKFECTENMIYVAFDNTQINQMIINLLKNAEEALQHNSVDPTIQVTLTAENDDLIITIEDNGCGFPEDLIKQSTNAYVTTRPGGMGLGLAIVKKIIQDHHGTMQIDNLLTRGSRITITLQIPHKT